jgi:hypothetical protein
MEFKASLDSICTEIDEWELPLALSELLSDFWPKFYAGKSDATMTKVLQVLSDYFNKPDVKDLPWGYTIGNTSTVEYWKYYTTATNEVLKIAGDFAIRMVACGVTECGVERIFSHVHWLIGVKRHQLGEHTLEDLSSLRYGVM